MSERFGGNATEHGPPFRMKAILLLRARNGIKSKWGSLLNSIPKYA